MDCRHYASLLLCRRLPDTSGALNRFRFFMSSKRSSKLDGGCNLRRDLAVNEEFGGFLGEDG